MLLGSLNEIERAIRAGWSADTCDPAETNWSPQNPARGQCAVTALVLHDLLGGELLIADARNADGSGEGYHYWNRFAGGLEVDLTREQFVDGEVLSEPEVVAVPADRSSGRLVAQYERLSDAVQESLRHCIDGPA